VGAVQKLAAIVIFGLVGIATVLVLYTADENNRIKAEEESQLDDAVERGIQTYLSYCLACHGPAGEGRNEPGAAGTGRIGAPLGGNTDATVLNQTGTSANGTVFNATSPRTGISYGSGFSGRTAYLTETIHYGKGVAPFAMPAWGPPDGALTDAQIGELVEMIQHVDWNEVYNKAIEANGGVYPTPGPAPVVATEMPATGGNPTPTPSSSGGGGEPTTAVEVDMVDIAFEPKEITIAANTDVTVTLVNKGAGAHTFDIDALNVNSGDVPAGETTTVTINAAPGTYEYYCAIPGHKEAGMVGTLIVK
jgi:plastocyanin/mono/diheme cytochrome c family protein